MSEEKTPIPPPRRKKKHRSSSLDQKRKDILLKGPESSASTQWKSATLPNRNRKKPPLKPRPYNEAKSKTSFEEPIKMTSSLPVHIPDYLAEIDDLYVDPKTLDEITITPVALQSNTILAQDPIYETITDAKQKVNNCEGIAADDDEEEDLYMDMSLGQAMASWVKDKLDDDIDGEYVDMKSLKI